MATISKRRASRDVAIERRRSVKEGRRKLLIVLSSTTGRAVALTCRCSARTISKLATGGSATPSLAVGWRLAEHYGIPPVSWEREVAKNDDVMSKSTPVISAAAKSVKTTRTKTPREEIDMPSNPLPKQSDFEKIFNDETAGHAGDAGSPVGFHEAKYPPSTSPQGFHPASSPASMPEHASLFDIAGESSQGAGK